ncbi:hypothetical protein Dimus_018889 [Dionaea muscipula]
MFLQEFLMIISRIKLQDNRPALPPSTGVRDDNIIAVASAVTHGIEVAIEFKPVEHPTEPLDNDQPVQCPLPEPSILNDGRIWKERVSAVGVRRRSSDMPLIREATTAAEAEATSVTKRLPQRSNHPILPSQSAPEPDILNLLEDYDTTGS